MGDLNYRFDNLTDFEVKYKIMKEAWSDLLDNDQVLLHPLFIYFNIIFIIIFIIKIII